MRYSHALIEGSKSINIIIDLSHLTVIENSLLKGIFICVRIEEVRVGIGVGTLRGQEWGWQSHCFKCYKI